MFGTKLRSWMETHIVRSRKKQHRNKENSVTPSNTKGKQSSADSSSKFQEEKNYERTEDISVKGLSQDAGKLLTKAPMNLQPRLQQSATSGNTLTCTVNNLSSPESAYSTGYSTDGTSPGASVPPEYYINIRTGTHYFPSQGEETDSKRATIEEKKVAAVNATVLLLTPRSARRRRDDAKKKAKQPADILHRESSTEEDVIDKVVKNNPQPIEQNSKPTVQHKIGHPMHNSLHRRTESYDESQCRPELFSPSHARSRGGETARGERGAEVLVEKDSGDSSSALTNVSYQCTSPYLSSASPRQRNRIRTNPWLGAQPNNQPNNGKNYNSQGETSSTVGSSSTISSSGCRSASVDPKNCFSPKSKEKKKMSKDEVDNCTVLKNSALAVSPVVRNRRLISSVTTCSPQLNRPCRHALHHGRSASSSSSSSASSQSSASNDDHHGNTSDFSDDDVTLNEMLGKFDESYVYEKETDILSDSDPTDCEEQADYSEEKVDNANANSLEGSQREDFEFIDNGSLAEFAYSDSECSASINTGHCTYYQLPGYTPELGLSQRRLRESVLRRHRAESSRRHKDRDSSRGPSRKRSSSQTKQPQEGDVNSSTELMVQNSSRKSSSRKKSLGSIKSDRKSSVESLPKSLEPNGILRHPLKPCLMNDPEKRNHENPAKHLNLNRVLMERLINNQRNGTRSADGTPVSLRRNASSSEYNGKYLRNHCVTKLINSNSNLNERRSSFESKTGSEVEGKKRSNSLSAYSSPVRVPISIKSSVASEINEADKEGDLKYRQLIQEAENILEDFQGKTKPEYLSPTFRVKSGARTAPLSPLAMKCQRQAEMANLANGDIFNPVLQVNSNLRPDATFLLRGGSREMREVSNGNDEGLLKTISKTLERIIARNSSDTNRKLDKSVGDPFQQKKRNLFANAPPPPPVYENILRRGSALSNIEVQETCPSSLSDNLAVNFSPKHNGCNLREFAKCNGSNLMLDSNDNTYRNFEGVNFYSRMNKLDPKQLCNGKISVQNEIALNTNFSGKNQDNIYSVYQHPRSPSRFDSANGSTMSPNINTNRMQNLGQQIPWHHRNRDVQERFKNQTDIDNFRKSSGTIRSVGNQKHCLTTFRSFDLGNGNVLGSRYCPQSEPVKRKVYSCSATFGKLQKSLMRKNTEQLSNSASTAFRTQVAEANDNHNSLKDKVAQLKRERLQVEARVRDSQGQIERLKLGENIETG